MEMMHEQAAAEQESGQPSGMVGRKFNKWEVLEVVPGDKENKYVTKLRCRCECGEEKMQYQNNVVHGRTKACKKCSPGRYKHGLSSSKLYSIWATINRHCSDPKHNHYQYYGGKGITVCAAWQDGPEAFITWCLDQGWVEGARVERIDRTKGYEPSNIKIVRR